METIKGKSNIEYFEGMGKIDEAELEKIKIEEEERQSNNIFKLNDQESKVGPNQNANHCIESKKINYKGKIKEIPARNPVPSQCENFIISRMRYCKFDKLKDSEFCIYHIPDENKELLVDCPIDSSHRVLISKLKKHMKICNKLEEKERLKQNDWYKEKINKVDISWSGIKQETLNEFYELKWEEISEQEYSDTIDKIIKCYEILKNDYLKYSQNHNLAEEIKSKNSLEKISLAPMQENFFKEILDDLKQSETEENKFDNLNVKFKIMLSGLEIDIEKDLQTTKNLIKSEKNGKQTAAIGDILKKYNLIDLENVYIEFGAGRGGLTDYIGKMMDHKSIHILLEREGVRYKKDRFYENMMRFRTDILDFDINYIKTHFTKNPQIKIHKQGGEAVPYNKIDFNLVGVAKHICGCAFDLSLACILNLNESDKIKAISMATCCHHVCRVEYLNNLEFYTDYLNLSIREIVLLFKATSWIFGPINVENSGECKDIHDYLKTNQIFLKKGLSKKYVGLISKYVVDLARVFFLIEKNFKVIYLKYCDNEITTENNLILAIKI